MLCATWLSHKHAPSESSDVWLLREDVVSQPVLPTVMRGRGLCSRLRYELLQYARHGAWPPSDTQGDWEAGQASTQNTSVETQQDQKKVRGEELGSAFLSPRHNSLPCKQSSGCRAGWLLCVEETELEKKGSAALFSSRLTRHHAAVVTHNTAVGHDL